MSVIFPDTSYSFQSKYYRTSEESLLIITGILGIGLMLISVILNIHLKFRISVLLGIIGCISIGLNLFSFLFISYFLPYTPSLWFYLSYFAWIGFCIINVVLIRFKDESIHTLKIILRNDKDKHVYSHFKKLRILYLFLIIIFFVSILYPFMYLPGDKPLEGYPGVHVLTIGGIEGIPLILISSIYLSSLQVRKAMIYGYIGIAIISINFFFVFPHFGNLFFPSVGFYLSFFSWIGFFIINSFLIKKMPLIESWLSEL
ncbi:MAG: hypothetical protein ACFFA3_21775 [Promethearchaeota archaeon]